MTTASSLAFPAMEVPAVEDSMEMASPYARQADDFDIDIDLMEDNYGDEDSNMMGADDLPNTSQPSLFPNDVNDDADMADEPSEGSMVDADNVGDEDHDVDIQYEESTYEVEMLEDDQNEPADTAVPSIQVDFSGPTEEAMPAQTVPVEEPAAAPIEEPIQGNPEVPSLPHEEPLEEIPGQEPTTQDQGIPLETSEVENTHLDEPENKENPQPSVAHVNVEPTEDTNQTTENNYARVDEHHTHLAPSAENLEASEVKSTSHETADEHAQHAETHSVHETEDQETNDESLHPVKVLYQDVEISLFPPFEGDSAETFFLHDETIAYEHVGRLFKSLRGVLLDNVAANEVLVIDIDALGIQITEDSSHTSKMTLHQILDVYLRLCRNEEETNEPEALYLTLSTKLAIDSELADLIIAANEGKGLSQIHPWDDYDEAELGAEESTNGPEASRSGDQPGPDEDHRNESTHSLDVAPEKQEPIGDEPHLEASETNKAEQQASADVEHPSGAPPSEPEPAVADVQHDQFPDDGHEWDAPPDDSHEWIRPDESVSDENEDQERFASEPRTASTSTVAPNEHFEGGSVNVAEDGVEHHDVDDPNGQGADEDEFDDEFGDDDLAVQKFAGEEEFEHQDELPNEEEAAGVDTTSLHEEEGAGQVPDAGPQEDEGSANVSHNGIDPASYDQSESTVENVPQEDPSREERTPEPEDDLLCIAEDLMQTPAKGHQDGQAEDFEGENQDENPEDGLNGPLDDEDADDQGVGDEDFDTWYPDFEATEVTEATETGGPDPSLTDSQAHDNPSTKRSREEDEEWDLADDTNPDTKRRRS